MLNLKENYANLYKLPTGLTEEKDLALYYIKVLTVIDLLRIPKKACMCSITQYLTQRIVYSKLTGVELTALLEDS